MGIYYAAPLLGPSLGPLIGGVLTQLFNWRATFWFLAIFGVISLFTFIVFKDTFRRERSMAYQAALLRLREQADQKASKRSSQATIVTPDEKNDDEPESESTKKDLEAQLGQTSDDPKNLGEVKLSLKDINPIGPLVVVLRRGNNLAVLFASGILAIIDVHFLI